MAEALEIEITPEMVKAGGELLQDWQCDSCERFDRGARRVFRRMLLTGGFKVLEDRLEVIPEDPKPGETYNSFTSD